MTFSQITWKTTTVAVAIATAGIFSATPAYADPDTVQFGETAEVPSPGGAIQYTVGNLQPSGHNDGIWYSNVVAQAVSGFPTPNISDFNARAVNSSTYADMKGNEVEGLPNQPIAMGTQATGRVYFDVRDGTVPDSVVYRDAGGTDKVLWKG